MMRDHSVAEGFGYAAGTVSAVAVDFAREHPIAILALFLSFFLLGLAYLATLQTAMKRVRPAFRPFAGALVWLTLVPWAGAAWLFIFQILLVRATKRDFLAANRTDHPGGMVAAIMMTLFFAIPIVLLGVLHAGVHFFPNPQLLSALIEVSGWRWAFWLVQFASFVVYLVKMLQTRKKMPLASLTGVSPPLAALVVPAASAADDFAAPR